MIKQIVSKLIGGSGVAKSHKIAMALAHKHKGNMDALFSELGGLIEAGALNMYRQRINDGKLPAAKELAAALGPDSTKPTAETAPSGVAIKSAMAADTPDQGAAIVAAISRLENVAENMEANSVAAQVGKGVLALTTSADKQQAAEAQRVVTRAVSVSTAKPAPYGQPMAETAAPAKPVLVGGQPLPVLPIPAGELALQPDEEKHHAIKHIRESLFKAIRKMDDRRDQDAYVRAVLELLPFSLRQHIAKDCFPQIAHLDPTAPEFRRRNVMPSSQSRVGEWMYIYGVETPGKDGVQVWRRYKLRFPWRGPSRGEVEILESEAIENPAITQRKESELRMQSAKTLEAHAIDFNARAASLRFGGSAPQMTAGASGPTNSLNKSITEQYASITDRTERRKFFTAHREILTASA